MIGKLDHYIRNVNPDKNWDEKQMLQEIKITWLVLYLNVNDCQWPNWFHPLSLVFLISVHGLIIKVLLLLLMVDRKQVNGHELRCLWMEKWTFAVNGLKFNAKTEVRKETEEVEKKYKKYIYWSVWRHQNQHASDPSSEKKK